MLNNSFLKKLFFLDIETVPQYPNFAELPDNIKELWVKKADKICRSGKSAAEIYPRSGIYAEFGKIICISVGVIRASEGTWHFKFKSYYGDNEKMLLKDFSDMLLDYEKKHSIVLCAHNGKEFDFPYIARRMLINQVRLPDSLNHAGKKPWEVNHLDTMDYWKFGDYKHYTSLELLTAIFDIPSPKGNLDGSKVCEYYWAKKDLPSIVKYCEADILAIAQLVMRYHGLPLIQVEA